MGRIDAKRKLWPLALFVLPAVLVKAASVTLFDVAQPRGAKAASPAAADAAIGPPPKRQWSAQEMAAAHYVQTLRSRPFGPPPMLHENSGAPRPRSTSAHPVPTPQAQPDPPVEHPRFTLQAVIIATGNPKALINGAPYVLGERIRGTQWVVSEIDPRWRVVVIQNSATGDRLELSHERSTSQD